MIHGSTLGMVILDLDSDGTPDLECPSAGDGEAPTMV